MEPVEVDIGVYQKQDETDVVALIHYTIISCYPKIYEPEIVQFFLQYHNTKTLQKKAKKGTFLILKINNKPVACGYLFKREIGGVYVHPEFQKKGYGKKLVSHLIELARKKSYDHIWLDAAPLAYDFYLGFGFKLTEKRTDYEEGKPLEYYRMVMFL